MSLYIYAPKLTPSVLELTRALDARRLRQFDGLDFWAKGVRVKLTEGDVVVCWGHSVPDMDGLRVLNGLSAPLSKVDELTKINDHGLRTVSPYKHVPAHMIPQSLAMPLRTRYMDYDVVASPDRPSIFVFFESFSKEYRIHSFNNRVILYGVKAPKEGLREIAEKDWVSGCGAFHPWVRSDYCGWQVNYNFSQTDPRIRKAAHSTLDALGLTFGAVDLAEREDGTLVVLKVDHAPDVSGALVPTYVKAINRWIEGKKQEDYEAGRDGAGREEPPF